MPAPAFAPDEVAPKIYFCPEVPAVPVVLSESISWVPDVLATTNTVKLSVPGDTVATSWSFTPSNRKTGRPLIALSIQSGWFAAVACVASLKTPEPSPHWLNNYSTLTII